MKLTAVIKKLEPRHPFTISRGTKSFVENVFIRIEDDGITAYGEASPNIYYKETAGDILTILKGLHNYLGSSKINTIKDIEKIWTEAWQLLTPSRAAQCALDIALWDLLGKKLNTPAAQLLWDRPPEGIISSCTLGLCTRSELPQRLKELTGYPVIKIKMNHDGDIDLPKFIHENSNAKLWVDANCSWGNLDIPVLLHKLSQLGVEMVEQPLPPGADNRMTSISKNSPLPVIADESCVVKESVKKLSGLFSGINIKLVKCGGITPAREMIKSAEHLGLKIMVGCMLESNLLISAGAALAQQAHYVDLDGNWLLKDNMFAGVGFKSGKLTISKKPGLGVNPAPGIFN